MTTNAKMEAFKQLLLSAVDVWFSQTGSTTPFPLPPPDDPFTGIFGGHGAATYPNTAPPLHAVPTPPPFDLRQMYASIFDAASAVGRKVAMNHESKEILNLSYALTTLATVKGSDDLRDAVLARLEDILLLPPEDEGKAPEDEGKAPIPITPKGA